MQKCKKLCGQQYDYSDSLPNDSTNMHKVHLWSSCLKISAFTISPCSPCVQCLWYTKHSDADMIISGYYFRGFKLFSILFIFLCDG